MIHRIREAVSLDLEEFLMSPLESKNKLTLPITAVIGDNQLYRTVKCLQTADPSPDQLSLQ